MFRPPSLLDTEDVLCNEYQEKRGQLRKPLEHLHAQYQELHRINKEINDLETDADSLTVRKLSRQVHAALESYITKYVVPNIGPVEQVHLFLQRYSEAEQKQAGNGASLVPAITAAIESAVAQVSNAILAISIMELLEVFLSFFWVKETRTVTDRNANEFEKLIKALDEQITSLFKPLSLEITAEVGVPASPSKIPASSAGASMSASAALSSPSSLSRPNRSVSAAPPESPIGAPKSPAASSSSSAAPSPGPLSSRSSRSDSNAARPMGLSASPSSLASPSRSSLVVPYAKSGYFTPRPVYNPVLDTKQGGSLPQALDLGALLARARLQRTRAKIALYQAADHPVPEDVQLARLEYYFQCQLNENPVKQDSEGPGLLEGLPKLVQELRQLKWQYSAAKPLSVTQQDELDGAELKLLSAQHDWLEERCEQNRQAILVINAIDTTSSTEVSAGEKAKRYQAASELREELRKQKHHLGQRLTSLRTRVRKSQEEKIWFCTELSCEVARLKELPPEPADAKSTRQADIELKSNRNIELQAEIGRALLIKEPTEHPCFNDNARIAAQPAYQSRLEYLTDYLMTNSRGSVEQAGKLEKTINQQRKALSRLCRRLMSGILLHMTRSSLEFSRTRPEDLMGFVSWLQVVVLIPEFNNKTLKPLLKVLQGYLEQAPKVEDSQNLTTELLAEAKDLTKPLSQSRRNSETLLTGLLSKLQGQTAILDSLIKTMEFVCQLPSPLAEPDSKAPLDLRTDFTGRVGAFDFQVQATQRATLPAGDDKLESKNLHTISSELKFFIQEGVHRFAQPKSASAAARSAPSPGTLAPDQVINEFSNYCQSLLTSPGQPLGALLTTMQAPESALTKVTDLSVMSISSPAFRSFRRAFLEDIDRVQKEAAHFEIEKEFMSALTDLNAFFAPLYNKLGLSELSLSDNPSRVLRSCKRNICEFVDHLRYTGGFFGSSSDAKGPNEYGKALGYKITLRSQKILDKLLKTLTEPTEEEKHLQTTAPQVFLATLFSELLRIKLWELLVTFIDIREKFLRKQPLEFGGTSKKSREKLEGLISNYVLTQANGTPLYKCIKWLRNLIMSPSPAPLDVARLDKFYADYHQNQEMIREREESFFKKVERSYFGRLLSVVAPQSNGSSIAIAEFLTKQDSSMWYAVLCGWHQSLRQELVKAEFNESSTRWLTLSAGLIRGEIRLQIADEKAAHDQKQAQARRKLETYHREQQQIVMKFDKLKASAVASEERPLLANLLSFRRLHNRQVAAQKLQAMTASWKKSLNVSTFPQAKTQDEEKDGRLNWPYTFLKVKTQGYLVTLVNEEKDLPLNWRSSKEKIIYCIWDPGRQEFQFNYVINWDGSPQARTIYAKHFILQQGCQSYFGNLNQDKRIVVPMANLSESILSQEQALRSGQAFDTTKVQQNLSEEESFQLSMELLQAAEGTINKSSAEITTLLAEPPAIPAIPEAKISEWDAELAAFRPLLVRNPAVEAKLAATQLYQAAEEVKKTFYPLFNSHHTVHHLFREYRRLRAQENLLQGLIKAGTEQAPVIMTKFAVETYHPWVEKIGKEVVFKVRRPVADKTLSTIPPQLDQALKRLEQGLKYGEIQDASIVFDPISKLEQKYASVVTLLFPGLGINSDSKKSPTHPQLAELEDKGKEFTKTKWVQRLAAVENLHAIIAGLIIKLTGYELELRSVGDVSARDYQIAVSKPKPMLFKCGSADNLAFYFYGYRDRRWQLTPLDQQDFEEAKLTFPEDAHSANRVNSATIPESVKRGHVQDIAGLQALLGHIEVLHRDLITGAWRRKIQDSPLEKANKGLALGMHLDTSTLVLIGKVLGEEGLDQLDNLGVMEFEVYDSLAPHTFTLWEWQFEERLRASYQDLFYEFLILNSYDVELLEYDEIFSSVKDNEKRYQLSSRNLIALADDTSHPDRAVVAAVIAPHDIDNFLNKHKLRAQVLELSALLGMLRTEQTDNLKWLDEVDVGLLNYPEDNRLAVKHPEWLTSAEVKLYETDIAWATEEEKLSRYSKLTIHQNTRLYITTPGLWDLRKDHLKFNEALRIKLIGIGLIGKTEVSFFSKKQLAATSLAWEQEIDKDLLPSTVKCALKDPQNSPKLFLAFPQLQSLMKVPADFNKRLSEELEKIKRDSKESAPAKKDPFKDLLTMVAGLKELPKMIAYLQELLALPEGQKAAITRELILNKRLPEFIRYLQEMLDQSNPHKLQGELLLVQGKQKDIIARFRKIVGTRIKLSDENPRSVITAFRELEAVIKKRADIFTSFLSNPGFFAAFAEAIREEPAVEESAQDEKNRLSRERSESSRNTRSPSTTPTPGSPSTPPKTPILNGKRSWISDLFGGRSNGWQPAVLAPVSPVSRPGSRSSSRAGDRTSRGNSAAPSLPLLTPGLADPLKKVSEIDYAVTEMSGAQESLVTLVGELKKSTEVKQEAQSIPLADTSFQGKTPAQLRMEFVGKFQEHQTKQVSLLQEIKRLTEETTALQKAKNEEKLPDDMRVSRIQAEMGEIRQKIEAEDKARAELIQQYESKRDQIVKRKSAAEAALRDLEEKLEAAAAVFLDRDSPSQAGGESKQDKEAKLEAIKFKLGRPGLSPIAKEGLKKDVERLNTEIIALTKKVLSIGEYRAMLQPAMKDQEKIVRECDEALQRSLSVIGEHAARRTQLGQDYQQLCQALVSMGQPDAFYRLIPMATLPLGTPAVTSQSDPKVRVEQRLREIDTELSAALVKLLSEKNQQLKTRTDELYELENWVLTPGMKKAIAELAAETAKIERNLESQEAKDWTTRAQGLITWLNEQPNIPTELSAGTLSAIADLKLVEVKKGPAAIKAAHPQVKARYDALIQEKQEIVASQTALIESVEELKNFIAKPQTRRQEELTAQSPLEITLKFEKLNLKRKFEVWNCKAEIIMDQVEGYFFNPTEYARVLAEQKRDNESLPVPDKLPPGAEKNADPATLRRQDKEIRARYVNLMARYEKLKEFVAERERALILLAKDPLPELNPLPQGLDKESELLKEFAKARSDRNKWRDLQFAPVPISQNAAALLASGDAPEVATDGILNGYIADYVQ